MQPHAETEDHRTTLVTPCPQPQAPWRITSVEPLPGFKLRVSFVDGTQGVVEMEAFIHSSGAGVFAALRDEGRFREAHVVLGAVSWPGDLDLAPDAMHREIAEHGRWMLA